MTSEPETTTEALLDRLRAYVDHESPSGDAVRATALARLIAGDLAGVGADVDNVEAPGWGIHLRAQVQGAEASREPVLILGHLDTVHPVGTLAAQPFVVENGRVEGPGVFDMKAGLVVLVESLRRLRSAGRRPRRPLRILVTCDEEAGSPSSQRLIEDAARGAAATLVLEPPLPGGGAKTARKGVATYRLQVAGRAAHAGVEPERGVSAVTELIHQLRHVLDLAQPEAGTTVNVGVIRGGTAANVVPAEAWADVDVRFTTAAEARRIDAGLGELRTHNPGAKLTIDTLQARPPLERTEGVLRLYNHARAVAAELGFELAEGSTGGGSDGSFTAALGVPTLDGLGVSGGGAHGTDEHILLDDLPSRVFLLERLLVSL